MKVVILQSNYFPWRGYFQLIKNCDLFIFYDEVKYTKNDWRNRNQVASKDKKKWLSIPISAQSVKLKISDVTLDFDPNWRIAHKSLLSSCYENCQFYESQIKKIVFPLIDEETNSLSTLNQNLIAKLSVAFGLPTKFMNSADLKLIDGRVEKLIDILKQVRATEYISGPAAKDYLSGSEGLFEEAGIELTFHSYQGISQYPSPQTLYSPDLSIVDLLANVDVRESKNYF